MRCARRAESATSPHTEVEIAALKRHLAGQGFEFDRASKFRVEADEGRNKVLNVFELVFLGVYWLEVIISPHAVAQESIPPVLGAVVDVVSEAMRDMEMIDGVSYQALRPFLLEQRNDPSIAYVILQLDIKLGINHLDTG